MTRHRVAHFACVFGTFLVEFFLVVGFASAQTSGTSPVATLVEHSKPLPNPQPGTLGTTSYQPTELEAPFHKKLSASEIAPGDMFKDYSITGKVGTYVGWFGIVRKEEADAARHEVRLLIEMKYFDGLTDTHILALSFNGAGDFVAVLSGDHPGIKLLSLVRVYGRVEKETDALPQVTAEYVRDWDWGLFTFLMAYGKQKGNTEWRKLNKVDLQRIYHPFPDMNYYVDRLGPREP
jgi:hypothetical protein